MTRYHKVLILIFSVVWVWAAINPKFPDDWLLENYLVFVFVPVIVLLGRYFRLSNLSYTLITLFMVLHVIGSHYTYEHVPLGEWLQHAFSTSRNMYDRIVHFSFGLLLAYPIREIFLRLARVKGFWGYYLPLDLTLAFSAIYELIEWRAAAGNSAAGIAFLGAQGDIWDAQKDMALAGLGALIAMFTVFVINWRYNRNFLSEFKQSFVLEKRDEPMGEVRLRELMRKR